ncbi:MAG TPA: hypothetical protein VFX63_07005, partial [Pyrinomonadaceae bacterium]|nr:hypothetical protein [Pyrinomonadaceae bacterium]
MNLNQPYLFYDHRTRFDQHLVRRFTQLSNNSALQVAGLDVASISAVAFQCNNNPGERSVANLLPLIVVFKIFLCGPLRISALSA